MMKTLSTIKLLTVSLLLMMFCAQNAQAQVEIPKDAWVGHAVRYFADFPLSNAFDGDLDTKFGMGGGANEGRWIMIDLGESYDVVKVKLTYIPGEQWKLNFIRGYDVYVTDEKYPFEPASGPKGDAPNGDLFVADYDEITASIPYPKALEESMVEFEATRGRYVYIVSNGPSGEWWEIHELYI